MNESLFRRAELVLPGGVNSPVRAFKAVGGIPKFISHAEGCRLTDVDGVSYVDYVGSWGPMILGHNHRVIREAVELAAAKGLSYGAPCRAEVELAELMTSLVPGLEMLRMTSSGTEAVMSALRVARYVTGRCKLIKFEGCYHGHSDAMLVKAGSGALTLGTADSGGVPESAAALTLSANYNDLGSVEKLLDANRGEVAAVIVEPAAANMGVVAPAAGFLKGLRELCSIHGTLLIFDEVITGFRLSPGGAAEKYAVTPDLYAFGKIIGGGLPAGAFGASREIMSCVAPLGEVYQAGTLSGNPIAMAAGLAQLRYLAEHREVYGYIDAYAEKLARGLAEIFRGKAAVNRVGSLLTVFFTSRSVDSYSAAKASSAEDYAAFFHAMLDCGFYLPPSRFEAWFAGAAHGEFELSATLEAAQRFARSGALR
ncbi:MAG: glutamate-1-semialdehyde 2,1-aminomutase [Oscillospiraceae bacterium]|jgi:glutamate-1-semialdehyde 2,1-aminomutase|nr:glutamate-1-semialdehyde 2,1-aminomutase [Oscillospiraceae bacterium]